MMWKYEVKFEIDVEAASPEQAAVIARDMLLDPDQHVLADVYKYEYCKEADDWFPNHKQGWHADFKKGVRPQHFFPWETLNAGKDR